YGLLVMEWWWRMRTAAVGAVLSVLPAACMLVEMECSSDPGPGADGVDDDDGDGGLGFRDEQRAPLSVGCELRQGGMR
ncbi:hypothetical protein C5167_009321, partial [Papaver somniferum]